jgi:hypothetical protein
MNNATITTRLANDHDFFLDVLDEMTKYGGLFVKALANCALVADPNNLQKLKIAFGEYFYDYAQMVATHDDQ